MMSAEKEEELTFVINVNFFIFTRFLEEDLFGWCHYTAELAMANDDDFTFCQVSEIISNTTMS